MVFDYGKCSLCFRGYYRVYIYIYIYTYTCICIYIYVRGYTLYTISLVPLKGFATGTIWPELPPRLELLDASSTTLALPSFTRWPSLWEAFISDSLVLRLLRLRTKLRWKRNHPAMRGSCRPTEACTSWKSHGDHLLIAQANGTESWA